MTNIQFKSAAISALIIYSIAVSFFIASYFVPIMEDPDLQANWVLSIVLIPIVSLGTHIYYRKGHQTNGFILGTFMFLIAGILDALITVPVFIIPYGGDYKSFFFDLSFWLIGVEYISVVAAYWQIEKAVNRTKAELT